MITEKDYCDYYTTVALEELGFPLEEDYGGVYIKSCGYKRPSLYEAQKWLREEKGVIVEVFVDDDSDTPITYNIYKDGECVCHHHGKYWSVKEWETALSEGLRASIKILQDEQKENN